MASENKAADGVGPGKQSDLAWLGHLLGGQEDAELGQQIPWPIQVRCDGVMTLPIMPFARAEPWPSPSRPVRLLTRPLAFYAAGE